MSTSRFDVFVRAHGRAALIAGLLAAMTGCSGLAPAECSSCPDQCIDNHCAELCVDGQCAAGHACIDYEGQALCDPVCLQDLCGDRQECSTDYGDCVAVECGHSVACEQATDICDAGQRRCFPANGDCSETRACPAFEAAIGEIAQIRCDTEDLLCTAERIEPILDFLPDADALTVQAPEPGQVFGDGEDIVFRWSPVDALVLVQVLDTIPSDAAELRAHLLWGADARDRTDPAVSWSEGHRIVDGAWQTRPGAPPTDRTLYLLVQALNGDELLGVSPLVPFRVGGANPWPSPGAVCAVLGAPGDCDHPARPQACVRGRCRILCGSHADCGPAGFCQPPQDGMRVCAL